jgi:hypothetical protein
MKAEVKGVAIDRVATGEEESCTCVEGVEEDKRLAEHVRYPRLPLHSVDILS